MRYPCLKLLHLFTTNWTARIASSNLHVASTLRKSSEVEQHTLSVNTYLAIHLDVAFCPWSKLCSHDAKRFWGKEWRDQVHT
jgi:hypothetical protein